MISNNNNSDYLQNMLKENEKERYNSCNNTSLDIKQCFNFLDDYLINILVKNGGLTFTQLKMYLGSFSN